MSKSLIETLEEQSENDLIDIADWAISRLLGRMKQKKLKGRALAKMQLIEEAKVQLEAARLA